MKKIVCLFLIITFFVPFCVYAENYENIAHYTTVTTKVYSQSVKYINDGIISDAQPNSTSEHFIVKSSGTEFIYDFVKVTEFNKIIIHEGIQGENPVLKGYVISVSQDKVKWNKVSEKSIDNYVCEKRVDLYRYIGEIEFYKQAARFVKIQFLTTENDMLAYLDEIEIYNTDKETVPEYVSFGSMVPTLPEGVISRYETVNYSEIIEKETEWIKSLSIDAPGESMHGAIKRNTASSNNYCTIDPYYATLGCLGLLEVADEESIEIVKNWVDWYIRHINRESDYLGATGTIYSWYVNKENISDFYCDNQEYSASDSRGSTFVILLNKLYEVTKDKDFLTARKEDIELILDSALFTWDSEYNLTASKNDSSNVKYLQDNVQVQAALKAMVSLCENVFNDSKMKNKYSEKQILHKNALEKMFIKDENSFVTDANRSEYVYYIANNIKLCDWSVFYGDSVSEIFPVLYDIEEDARGKLLYEKFSSEQPGRVARYGSGLYPWMATALLSAKMGDYVRVNEQLATAKKIYTDTGRTSAWNVYESGNTIRAAKTIRDKLNLAYKKDALFDGALTSFLTDGNLSTNSYGSEFIVDLTEPKTVNRAILNGCGSYELSCSLSGEYYTSFGISEQSVCDFSKITARYFKFTFENPICVSEIELYFEAENLMENASLKANTSSYIPNANATYAFDNSTSTKWVSKINSETEFAVKLNGTYPLSCVEILWDGFNKPERYEILLSEDGLSYTKVAYSDSPGFIDKISFQTKMAQAIKIKCNDRTAKSIGIFEIRVYDNSENPALEPEYDKLPEIIEGTVDYFEGNTPIVVKSQNNEQKEITGNYIVLPAKVSSFRGYLVDDYGFMASLDNGESFVKYNSQITLTDKGAYGLLFYNLCSDISYQFKQYIKYVDTENREHYVYGIPFSYSVR